MLTHKTVIELLDAFSSADPTPGGGSASALAGALGASLLAMVAGMPKTKPGTPEARAALAEARAQLLGIRATLVDLVDRDAAAYDQVVAAYKRPRVTDEDQAARKAAIQHAMRLATEVPLETIRACTNALKAGGVVAEHGNPSARSDLAVGVHLLGTASQGALLNVEINLGSVTDPDVVGMVTTQLRALFADSPGDMVRIYQAAGIVALMKQAASRAGQLTPAGRRKTVT